VSNECLDATNDEVATAYHKAWRQNSCMYESDNEETSHWNNRFNSKNLISVSDALKISKYVLLYRTIMGP
jgi:hypothetical protein